MIIEQLTGYPGGPLRATPFILNEGTRDLVLRDVLVLAGQTYVNTGTGRLFMENVGGTSSRYWSNLPNPLPSAVPQFDFGTQQVWARQLNTEQRDVNVRNDGGDLWILGIKNEEDGTLVQTRNGGRTEILGGTAMPLDVYDDSANGGINGLAQPGFEIIGACMSIVVAGHMGWARDHYHILVRETRADETRDLLTVDAANKRTYANSAGVRPPVLALYRGSILSESEHWRRNVFGASAPTSDSEDEADPDGDGIPNLLERAFGGDALQPQRAVLPVQETVVIGQDAFAALTFTVLAGGEVEADLSYVARGLRYRVEQSTDLHNWVSGDSVTSVYLAPVDQGDGTKRMTLRSNLPFAAQTPVFLRLAVENLP
ncbi:MAG: hypothetical protein LR015_12035 [Verrucomicrobia bacterium]|nr:hypothetical protein [Verrucomicrobiota bacterium]